MGRVRGGWRSGSRRRADASTALATSIAVVSRVRATPETLEGSGLARRDAGPDRATRRGGARTSLRPRCRAGTGIGARRAPGLWSSRVLPPPEYLPGRRVRRHRPAEHALQALGAIQDAAPVLGAVLPRQALASGDQPPANQLVAIPVDVHDAREVLVAADIEVEPVVMPVGPPPERHAHDDADAEGEEAAHDPSRRVVVVRRIGRIGPRAVDDQRIIGRHVDHAGLGRLDADDRCLPGRRGLQGDDLLRRGGERALGLGPRAETLDRLHQLLALPQGRVAQLLGPRKLLVHHAEDLGERDEGLHAVVPVLGGQRLVQGLAGEAGIGLDESRGHDHLERIGGRHQHLRQERVGVERDRRGDLLQLLRSEGPGRDRLLGEQRERRGERHGQQAREGVPQTVPPPAAPASMFHRRRGGRQGRR